MAPYEGIGGTASTVSFCNCCSTACDCNWGQSAPAITIYIERSAANVRLELPPDAGPYWPSGIDELPKRLLSRRARRWREYAYARRHPRHNRAPPMLSASV